jgi:hypothetical protein
MSGLSLSRISAMLSAVMPNSSAWMVAMTAQFTASAHWSSPSRTAGPSGSLEKASSKIVSESGPPSASGKAERTPASCDWSDVQPSHCSPTNASWICSGSVKVSGV